MSELDPIRDFHYDFAGADALAQSMRATANLIEQHCTSRAGHAGRAREDWRGRFSQEFGERHNVGRADGQELARALWRAASALDEMTSQAHAAQRAIEAAKEWTQRRNNRSWLSKAVDNVHDFVAGEDDFPPPPPKPPPNFQAAGVVRSR